MTASIRALAGASALSVLGNGVAAATTFLVALTLPASGFGRFTVVVTIALIAGTVLALNLHLVVYRVLPQAGPADRPALLTTALVGGVTTAGALTGAGLLVAPALGPVLGVDAPAVTAGLLLALALVVGQLAESCLRGIGRAGRASALRAGTALAHLVVVLWFLFGLGVDDPVPYIGLLAAGHVAFAVLAVASAGVRPRSWSPRLLPRLYRGGGYVTAVGVLATVHFGVDVLLLNALAGPADVGVYSVYNGFPKRLLGVVFTEGIALVLLPALAVMAPAELRRRVRRLAPLVGAAAALLSFAGSAVLFWLLPEGYPYSPGLMALCAVGIGVHTVYNLHFLTLSMDGPRGTRVVLRALAVTLPVAVAAHAACIAAWGLTGAMVGFALANALILAAVLVVSRRTYADRPEART